jgi:hypothetical protein
MRTGPCASTGPHATTRTVRRWVLLAVVRPDRHYLLLATGTAQPADAFQPLRPCRERWAERNPLPGNSISVRAGGPHRCRGLLNPGQFGLDHQHGATVHSSSNAQPHRRARRLTVLPGHKSAV